MCVCICICICMCIYVCVCMCVCVNLMVNEYNFHIFYKTFGTCQTTNHICNCFFTNDYVIRCYQTFLRPIPALVSTGGVGEVAGDVGEGEVNEGPGCGFSCCFLCIFAASRFCERSLSLFTFFFTFPMLAQIRNGKKQRNFTRTKKLQMINTHTSACHSVGE